MRFAGSFCQHRRERVVPAHPDVRQDKSNDLPSTQVITYRTDNRSRISSRHFSAAMPTKAGSVGQNALCPATTEWGSGAEQTQSETLPVTGAGDATRQDQHRAVNEWFSHSNAWRQPGADPRPLIQLASDERPPVRGPRYAPRHAGRGGQGIPLREEMGMSAHHRNYGLRHAMPPGPGRRRDPLRAMR